MQHSVDRLTMDSPNVSRMIWSTMPSLLPSQDSENSSKLLTHDTGNKKEKSHTKPTFLEPPETSPNRSLTPTSLTARLAKVLPSPNRTTTTPTQGNGSTSKQKKSTTPNLSLKLGNNRKLTPQEHQHCYDNKHFLFCGTAGHIAKDCPKSTLASSKA